jgi:hypothetical protein
MPGGPWRRFTVVPVGNQILNGFRPAHDGAARTFSGRPRKPGPETLLWPRVLQQTRWVALHSDTNGMPHL